MLKNRIARLSTIAALVCATAAFIDPRQTKQQKAPDLILREYHPKSMLVTEYHVPQRAKFQVIDVHNHLGNVGSRGSAVDPAACIKADVHPLLLG
jgi:hypothetical protein